MYEKPLFLPTIGQGTNESKERNTKRFNPVDNRDVVFKSTWVYLRRGLKRLVFLSFDPLVILDKRYSTDSQICTDLRTKHDIVTFTHQNYANLMVYHL